MPDRNVGIYIHKHAFSTGDTVAIGNQKFTVLEVNGEHVVLLRIQER